jgi:hypothetical protein
MKAFKITLVLIAAMQNLCAANNVVSGVIRDEAGAAVSSPIVQLTKIPESKMELLTRPSGGATPSANRIQAGNDGSFTSAAVPAGKYYICAYTSLPGYVSNCDWTAQAPTVTIDGTHDVVVDLKLIKGTVIQVFVDDPQRLIDPKPVTQFGSASHHFYPGVISAAGYYVPARYISESGTRKLYSVTIPRTVAVNLFIDTDLSTSAPTGEQVVSRRPSSIAISGGPASTSVSLTVE